MSKITFQEIFETTKHYTVTKFIDSVIKTSLFYSKIIVYDYLNYKDEFICEIVYTNLFDYPFVRFEININLDFFLNKILNNTVSESLHSNTEFIIYQFSNYFVSVIDNVITNKLNEINHELYNM